MSDKLMEKLYHLRLLIGKKIFLSCSKANTLLLIKLKIYIWSKV